MMKSYLRTATLRCRPEVSVTRRARWSSAASVLATLLAAGCGDTPGAATPSSPAAAVPQAVADRPPGVADLAIPPSAPAGPARYALVLMNDRAVHQDLDQLDPQRGKGYQPLRAFVYVQGRPRGASPVAGVRPVCPEPTRCEYLPPRRAGFAERYVVTIDDASVAELGADEDMVALRPRQLALAEPATLQVTLTVDGQRPQVRRIVYGSAAE